VVNKINSSGTTSYTWDFENRLTSVVLPGTAGTVTFKYDPFGRRIQKSSTAGVTDFAYDGDNLIEEMSSSGAAVASYAQGLGIDEPLAMYRGGAGYAYHADGLGSIVGLTDASGNVAATYTYDSFGNTSSTGTVTNPFRYTGRESDTETGLYYYRVRYYDPSVGRFASEDPIGFDGGINFYRYVENNPLLLVDPSGLSSLAFDRGDGTLTLYTKDGAIVAVCKARNNTTRTSNGPWPTGNYSYAYHKSHPEDPGKNGAYGLYGIFIFTVPGRTGMGVHSGRKNRGGPNFVTKGCIRTTDDCMKAITDWQRQDPLTDITIE
jgi:RHS repeat-associated protein